MVTALDDRDTRLQGIMAGADDFISKRFDGTELRARVRTITRLNRYRRLVRERAKFERMVELMPMACCWPTQPGQSAWSIRPCSRCLASPGARICLVKTCSRCSIRPSAELCRRA